MAVTHTFAIGREQCFQEIDKLIKSHSLHTSESLCKLLRYLAEHSLDHPGIALKEYQIATEVGKCDVPFDVCFVPGICSRLTLLSRNWHAGLSVLSAMLARQSATAPA